MATLSCQTTDETQVGPLNGTYTGIFYRTSSGATHEISNVTLILEGNRFEGTSSIVKYPAICRGTFILGDNVIEFENGCAWTAEFDWSYILSGKFRATQEGDEVVMTKTYSGFYDTYRLKRE